MLGELLQGDMGRQLLGPLQMGGGHQLQQMAIAGLVLDQQDQRRHGRRLHPVTVAVELAVAVPVGLAVAVAGAIEGRLLRVADLGQRDDAADDRLDAGLAGGRGELQGAEEVVAVRHGDGRHVVALAELDQLLDLDRALGERIGAVDVEMDEVGVRHGAIVPRLSQSRTGFCRRPAPRACGRI